MSLRIKLILLFLLFALIPTFQLYWASRSMLSSTLALGLNEDVAGALEKAQEVSQRLTDKEKENLVAGLSQISENGALAAALASGDRDSMVRLLKLARQRQPLGVLCAYDSQGRLVGKDPAAEADPLSSPERRAGMLWEVPRVLEFNTEKGFIRGGAPVFRDGKRIGFIAAQSPLGAFYRERLGTILKTLESYASLLGRRENITLGLDRKLQGTLVVMLALALLFSLYVTRALLVPVWKLSQAAEAVSAGSLKARVSEEGSGELAELARIFNRMTESLASAQEKLSRASREQAWREAAQAVAHEIKNPLTPMALAMEDLRDGPWKGASGVRVKEAASVVLREIENLRRLASGFSQFARLPRAKPKAHDLEKLLNAAAELYSAGKRLSYERPQERFSVLADAGLFQQAMVNLIENGFKASPASGKVSLSAGKALEEAPTWVKGLGVRRWVLDPEVGTPYVWILVEDQGRGIAPVDLSRIFEPHVSLAPGGSGLGLALVSRIGADHGAALAVQSALGKGTAFHLGLRASQHE